MAHAGKGALDMQAACDLRACDAINRRRARARMRGGRAWVGGGHPSRGRGGARRPASPAMSAALRPIDRCRRARSSPQAPTGETVPAARRARRARPPDPPSRRQGVHPAGAVAQGGRCTTCRAGLCGGRVPAACGIRAEPRLSPPSSPPTITPLLRSRGAAGTAARDRRRVRPAAPPLTAAPKSIPRDPPACLPGSVQTERQCLARGARHGAQAPHPHPPPNRPKAARRVRPGPSRRAPAR